MRLLVTNVQSFCLHDGPGIRTTVFLKGCSLHCPWCCNPENITCIPQFYFKRASCIANGGNCMYGECLFANMGAPIKEALERLTEKDVGRCKSGALGVYGKWYEAQELYQEIISDLPFWEAGGGVTFSGGEPLLQFDALKPLLVWLKEKGVDLCAETALYVPTSTVKEIGRYFDRVYVDVKLLDAQRCRTVLGGDLHLYEKNLECLAGQKIPVCLRHPCIAGYTDDFSTEEKIRALREKYPTWEYQVLSEHHLGSEKAVSIGYGCEGEKGEVYDGIKTKTI